MSQNKIYVGNLPYSVTDEELKEHFGQYGDIQEVKIITDFEGRSKGFGFITFEEQTAAQESLASDGNELSGRQMKVNMAREDKKRTGGGSGRGGYGGGGGGGGGSRRPRSNNRSW